MLREGCQGELSEQHCRSLGQEVCVWGGGQHKTLYTSAPLLQTQWRLYNILSSRTLGWVLNKQIKKIILTFLNIFGPFTNSIPLLLMALILQCLQIRWKPYHYTSYTYSEMLTSKRIGLRGRNIGRVLGQAFWESDSYLPIKACGPSWADPGIAGWKSKGWRLLTWRTSA